MNFQSCQPIRFAIYYLFILIIWICQIMKPVHAGLNLTLYQNPGKFDIDLKLIKYLSRRLTNNDAFYLRFNTKAFLKR